MTVYLCLSIVAVIKSQFRIYVIFITWIHSTMNSLLIKSHLVSFQSVWQGPLWKGIFSTSTTRSEKRGKSASFENYTLDLKMTFSTKNSLTLARATMAEGFPCTVAVLSLCCQGASTRVWNGDYRESLGKWLPENTENCKIQPCVLIFIIPEPIWLQMFLRPARLRFVTVIFLTKRILKCIDQNVPKIYPCKRLTTKSVKSFNEW